MFVFEGKSGKNYRGDTEIKVPYHVIKPHSLFFPEEFHIDEEDSFQIITDGRVTSMNLNLLLALSEIKTTRDGILCIFPDYLLPILLFNRILTVWMKLKISMSDVKYKLQCIKIPDPAQDIPLEIPYYYPLYSYDPGGLIRQNRLIRLHRLYIIAPIGFNPSLNCSAGIELESKTNGGIVFFKTVNAVRQSIGHRLPVELVDMILGYLLQSWTLYTYKLDRSDEFWLREIELGPGPARMHTLHHNSFESWLGRSGLRYIS